MYNYGFLEPKGLQINKILQHEYLNIETHTCIVDLFVQENFLED